jgi:hypothetical protein
MENTHHNRPFIDYSLHHKTASGPTQWGCVNGEYSQQQTISTIITTIKNGLWPEEFT